MPCCKSWIRVTRERIFFAPWNCAVVAEIVLQPTFIPFTPWTTFEQLQDLFEQLNRLDLVEAVAPIQLGIRLLIPPGSRLLELEEVREMVGPFDAKALIYPWKHPNPAIDRLCEGVAGDCSLQRKTEARAYGNVRENVADGEPSRRTGNARSGSNRCWPHGPRCRISTSLGIVERSRRGTSWSR